MAFGLATTEYKKYTQHKKRLLAAFCVITIAMRIAMVFTPGIAAA